MRLKSQPGCAILNQISPKRSTTMDQIKEKIEEIVEKIKNSDDLLTKFKTNPIKTVENLIGINLPDDTIEKIVEGVKAKITLDKLDDLKDDLGGALGALKKLF